MSDPFNGHASTTTRIGAITRELHEALRALGAAPELQRVVQEMPGTRERLAYVGEMAEHAATQVLNFVDEAGRHLDRQDARSTAFLATLDSAVCGPVTVGCENLAGACRDHVQQSLADATQQREVLNGIMMTQSFQDLSGQVIAKVIDMITRTEQQLCQFLSDEAGSAQQRDIEVSVLVGPQTPATAMGQDDVDALLASMNF
jgi:chemotaxis protein CheZ